MFCLENTSRLKHFSQICIVTVLELLMLIGSTMQSIDFTLLIILNTSSCSVSCSKCHQPELFKMPLKKSPCGAEEDILIAELLTCFFSLSYQNSIILSVKYFQQ